MPNKIVKRKGIVRVQCGAFAPSDVPVYKQELSTAQPAQLTVAELRQRQTERQAVVEELAPAAPRVPEPYSGRVRQRLTIAKG